MVVWRRESQQGLGCGDTLISAWWARLLAARRGCCFLACIALLQPHCTGSRSFDLTGMKIILKNHTTVYSEPRADGFVLFDRKGQRNHNSTAAKAHGSTECALYPNGETLSDGGAGGAAMGSSSRWQDLRSPHLHILQSLGLASAESMWWPGSPCRVRCCRRGEWAAEHFQAHP